MLSLTILSFLATSALSLAIRRQDGGGVYSPTPSNTTVTYYTGSNPSAVCVYEVGGTGTFQQGVCNTLTLSGYSIGQAPNNNCTLTLYSGSTSCDVDATEITAYTIPAGNGTTCVASGVPDGGKFYHASAVWSCS